ncbi:glycosyltransferase family 1 protein [Planococcus glaciei]|nr:glycosyltransferase family 1 protein [Planococcus glaciei]QDY44832.1 glycosyltransferase family 1 protein [Planococcus glaciei]
MKPIRILQVLASLDIGGAEMMIMNIYRNIDKSKIQFDFVVNDQIQQYAFESEIESMGGRIYRIPRYKITNYLAYKKVWEDLLLEHPEWQVIHGHHTSPAFIYLPIAKRLKRNTIAHSHTAGSGESFKSKLKILTRYPIRHMADYLFSCSALAGEWMFGKKKKIYVLNNAIDTNKFLFSTSSREEKRLELQLENKFVIGHVGRMYPEKNHFFLIDIFDSIYKQNNNTVLLLIGDGKLRSQLEKKVMELNLSENVIFTGIRNDIPELMQAMDLFLFPSLYEGLPVTLIEAQASGLPCVVSNTVTEETKITNHVDFSFS